MSMRRSLRRVKVGAMATVSTPRARAWMMVVVDRVAVTPMSARYLAEQRGPHRPTRRLQRSHPLTSIGASHGDRRVGRFAALHPPHRASRPVTTTGQAPGTGRTRGRTDSHPPAPAGRSRPTGERTVATRRTKSPPTSWPTTQALRRRTARRADPCCIAPAWRGRARQRGRRGGDQPNPCRTYLYPTPA